jgi:hypothetical protein
MKTQATQSPVAFTNPFTAAAEALQPAIDRFKDAIGIRPGESLADALRSKGQGIMERINENELLGSIRKEEEYFRQKAEGQWLQNFATDTMIDWAVNGPTAEDYAGKTPSQDRRLTGAAEMGSKEAWSSILAAMGFKGAGDHAANTAKNTAAAAEALVAIKGEIVGGEPPLGMD